MIPAGATSGTFTTATTSVVTNRTASITASYLTSVQSAALTISAPAQLSTLGCSLTKVASGQSLTCTVTLTGITTGVSVSITSNNAALTAPASVTVPSGSASASFTMTAGMVSVDQPIFLTATLNTESKTALLTVVAPSTPAQIGGFSCSPGSLTSGGSASCTITLSKAAPPEGAVVALSSASLTTPSVVTIASGLMAGSFTATAGSVVADQTAPITASYNGGTQTFSFNLLAASDPSSIICSPATLTPGGTAYCTVTLTKVTGIALSLSPSSDSAAITVPASVPVLVGVPTTTFPITAVPGAAPGSVTIQVQLNGKTQSTTVMVSSPTLAGLSCSPASINANATGACTLTLMGSVSPVNVNISSTSSALTVPSSVSFAANQTTATFQVIANAPDLSTNRRS